jgi:glycine oxidase
MGSRIAIAGAGLLGRLLAFELLQRGHAVTLFDPAPSLVQAPLAGDPARAAGWTAAGMLSPTAELECATEHVFHLGLDSLQRWPHTVATLAGAGLPVAFQRQGSLLLAHRGDEGAARRVVDLLHHKAPADHAPQALSLAELRTLEPDVHGPAHGWLLPHEGLVHTVQTMTALGQFALDHGVDWCGNTPVTGVSPGQVHTAQGTEHFDQVFDVRGTGARQRAGAVDGSSTGNTPSMGDVRGVRGEVFWLHAPGVVLNRPVRLLHPRWRVYVVPRPGDLVVVGATEIESEDRSPVSVRSALELLSAAHSVLPGLSEARIVHSEANLRPALPDNLPRTHAEPGLTRINGLFRHGWLIAPALVAQALHTVDEAVPA